MNPPILPNLIAAIRTFVASAGPSDSRASLETFDRLALDTLRLQAARLPGFANLVEQRRGPLEAWTRYPPVPSLAFKHLRLTVPGEPSESIVFRSSGTSSSASRRAEHTHTQLDLYRLVIDRSFPRAVFGAGPQTPQNACSRATPAEAPKRPLLSLIAPLELVSDSSLGFMVDHVVRAYGTEDSRHAFHAGSLSTTDALEWLQQRAPTGERPVLLTTALALWSLLEHHDSVNGGPWPEDLVIMETGGFKTRRRELSRRALLDRLGEQAGVHADRVVREYGMSELTSQAYSRPWEGTTDQAEPSNDLLFLPPWTRVRALDPDTLEDKPAGEIGMLAFLDLGNVGSAAYVSTEDLGCVPAGGASNAFELVGRAVDAELRGCSLTTESLLAAGTA